MIFLTGGAFTARARRFIEGSDNLWLKKPFRAQQLRQLVNERVG